MLVSEQEGGLMTPAIELQDVWLGFRAFYHRSGSMAQWIETLRHIASGRPIEKFWALKDVSLSVQRGSVVGLIGPNGSGKTTLLRVMAGIFPPDQGEVHISGRVSTLLALGTGFNNSLCAADNIRVSALIAGISAKRIPELIENVIEFTELEQFREMPLKFYSSGMYSRLAFGIAMSIEPDILLIDEIFSVGDILFQNKAASEMAKLRSKAHSQVVATHDLGWVADNCSEAFCLVGGKILFTGKAKEVVDAYKEYAEGIKPAQAAE